MPTQIKKAKTVYHRISTTGKQEFQNNMTKLKSKTRTKSMWWVVPGATDTDTVGSSTKKLKIYVIKDNYYNKDYKLWQHLIYST